MLYNEERPVRFSDARGQEANKLVLRKQVEKGAFSQAYLFAGHHGSGKTTFARILGRAAVCEHPVNGEPCNECESCKNFASSIDVVEIDAASNTGVDAIREKVIEAVKFEPVMMKKKIIIIDECHMLSTSAFNALLKTLEEPPKNVIIFLCTTELHKVPKTIVSRCQKFIFSGIPVTEIFEHINEVSKKHGFVIEEKAAMAIAKAADGSMRDALSLLEQAASEGNITYKGVSDMLGNGNVELVDDIITFTNKGELVKAVSAVDEFLTSSDLSHLIDSIMERVIERVVEGDDCEYLELIDRLAEIRGKSATVTTLKAVIYSLSVKENTITFLKKQVEELSKRVEELEMNKESVVNSDIPKSGAAVVGENIVKDKNKPSNDVKLANDTNSHTNAKEPENNEKSGNNAVGEEKDNKTDAGNGESFVEHNSEAEPFIKNPISDSDLKELESMGFSNIDYDEVPEDLFSDEFIPIGMPNEKKQVEPQEEKKKVEKPQVKSPWEW